MGVLNIARKRRIVRKSAAKFTKEEQRLFDENLPYALSLVHLYPKLDQGELSSIAYRSLMQALRGYGMRTKEKYDPKRAKVKTLVDKIFRNEVMRYTKEEGKVRKREPFMEEKLKPTTEEGEEIPAEETIKDLKEVMQESTTEEALMQEQLEDILSKEDYDIVKLLLESSSVQDITNAINDKYDKEQTWQRYNRHIELYIKPKLEQLMGEREEEVEEIPLEIVSPQGVPA